MINRRNRQQQSKFILFCFKFLYPSQASLSVVRVLAAFLLLITVAKSSVARFILLLFSLFVEFGFIKLSRSCHAQQQSRHVPFLLIASVGLWMFQYMTLLNIDTATKSEIWFSGIRIPPKDFPGATAGESSVITGPFGVVPSPFNHVNEGSVVTAIVNHAINDGAPYVTGDDFSIIIPGREEHPYITKTIQYTIDNTPRKYIKEIVVVDDCSSVPLAEVLERELPKKYKSLVKVIRFNDKQGLIRARIAGADASTGANLFFLDGHCKPKKGWIEPLLKHLKTNYKRIACPIIEDINNVTWADVGTSGAKMMFEWNFEFGWYDDHTDEVPISAGGILALTRRWWTESGKYDPGMLEWGGENLEQSMRVWMCGGEIYVVRDSFVGHIFDRPAKPNPENKLVTQVQKNQKRAALVWLDDYYQYFEKFHPVVTQLDEGPGLEERILLRQKLNCRSFQWYVDKFKTAFERKGLLVDEFRYILHRDSRWCLTAAIPIAKDSLDNPSVVLDLCRRNNPNSEWQAVAGGRMLYNRESKKCLDTEKSTIFGSLLNPVLIECKWNEIFLATVESQFWQFDSFNSGRIFTYSTKRFKTLTGNDKFPIDATKAVSLSSRCLQASVNKWSMMKIMKQASIYGQFTPTTLPVTIEPCFNPVLNHTAALGVALDSQRFEWM